MFRKDAESAIDTVFESIAHSLETGRRVALRGFGNFGLKDRQASFGRNLKTRASVLVEGNRVVFFKTGKVLREMVDSKDERQA
jgi:integration host factor subunit beta